MILFKRGLLANLPAEAQQGEPVWTLDGKDLYVGQGAGNPLVKSTQNVENWVNTNFINKDQLAVNDGVATLTGSTVTWAQLPVNDASISSTSLWSSDKINSMLTAGVAYMGHWNPATNTPNLIDEVGANGQYYIVDTAGTIDLSAAQDGTNTLTFKVGDHVIFSDADGGGPNPGLWEKSINSNNIQTVNGQSNVVVLDGSHIVLTGYVKAAAFTALTVTDTINQALGKLEKGIEDAQSGGELNVQADWTQGNAANDDFIKNKPTDLTVLSGHDLSEMSDITITANAAGNVLTWDGAKWVNQAPEAVEIDTLDEIGDVNVTGVSDGQMILWDDATSKWIAADLPTGVDGTFKGLTDTPANYAGAEGFTVKVNAAGDGVEFIDESTVDGGTF